DVQRTANTLESAHGRAKSVALRNPQAVTGSQALAAGLKYEEADGSRWLLVCRGDPAQAQCAAGGTGTDISVEWRAELPAGVTLTVGGSAMDVHGLNNTGQAVGTGGAIAPLAYEVTKGVRSHASELR